MDEDKIMEMTSLLEESRDLLKGMMEMSKDMEECMKGSGDITLEKKEKLDNLVRDSEECCKKLDALLDANEMPM